jgi:uncharacterized membrane protein (DUF4010 family)
MDYSDITTLGIAFGLGLLVGLQREASRNKLAGVRTFSLIAVLGAMAGFLTRDFDNPFVLPLFAIALTIVLYIGNMMKLKTEQNPDIGQTTEVAALLMFAIGGYLVLGDHILGIIAGGGMAVLLFVKERLHGFIAKLKEKDLDAIMTFAAITLVILPILPDKTYGPMEVLNPHNIWLMVVLIVGISVVGYFIYKFVDQRVGIISNGILGGLISSTATTVSYARKTVENKPVSGMAAFVITAASAIALVRVLIEVGVVIPGKLKDMMLPLIVEFLVMAGLCVALFYMISRRDSIEEMPEPKNPAQFRSALIFGLLYGIILLAVAFAKEEFSSGALYLVVVISGLTDVDAITLSLSQLMKQGSLQPDNGWRLILLASVSNLFFKGIMAAVLGSRQLVKWIAPSFGISILAGLLLIWLWPANWHF